MPAQKRITFFFKNDNGAGWSETFYVAAATIEAALVAGERLATVRRPLLAQGNELLQIRASLDDPLRDSRVSTSTAGAPGAGERDTLGATANLALLCRIEAGSQFRRQLYLRGVPDDTSVNNGRLFAAAGYLTVFNRFKAEVIGGGWGIRALQNNPALRVPIAVMAQSPTGLVTITTTDAHGVTARFASIVIRGGVGGKRARGRWRAFVTGPLSMAFYSTRILDSYFGGATLQVIDYDLQDIDTLILLRVGKRAAGRPFDVPHGRRRRVG